MHGKNAIMEEVLDWRPSDYITVSTLLPIPGAPKIMLTHAFQDRTNGATHIEIRVGKPKPKDKDFVDQAAAKLKKISPGQLETCDLCWKGGRPLSQ